MVGFEWEKQKGDEHVPEMVVQKCSVKKVYQKLL